MEGIDLAGVVDSDFQGILINFAPPRPAGFANFRGAGQDLLFAGRGGAALFPRGGAGRTSLFFGNEVCLCHFVLFRPFCVLYNAI